MLLDSFVKGKKWINFRLSWYTKILNDTTKINKICDFHTSGEGRKNGVEKNREKVARKGKKKKKDRTKTTIKDNANFHLKCITYYIKFNWTESQLKDRLSEWIRKLSGLPVKEIF